jgi:hypothetical protein
MTDPTLEDVLRQAEALALQAVREAEARCGVLGHYISDCESKGARTAAWRDAVRELSAQQEYRSGLRHRQSLIRQALEYPAGECPAKVALPPPPNPAPSRTQYQVQIQRRRRS